ncbi:MAG: efflux RND transporter permease subunit [Oscillospiraceae bacterium]|jgi:predicted RND superfamily exporter protein
MIRFGKAVVKHHILILILSVLLLIPSVIGMACTRINYDMLDYLPKDIDTFVGQDILLKDFGKGAFSFIIVEGMEDQDISALKEKLEQIDHVESILWYDSLLDPSVPKELLPEKYYNAFNTEKATMMAVFFDTSTSADETMHAITEIRNIAGKQCFVSGMSALVTDLKALCEREEPIYVGLAVACSCAIMVLLLDSWLIPFVFLISIGMAILLNLGSNYFLGEISYITKALAAVLQLGVTMDYSIFLWHFYCDKRQQYPNKEEAMAHAIAGTVVSVTGSSITTIAGFIALCFMSYTMGKDLGIVMAKGVLFGVLGSVTTLPALILLLDKPLQRTRHRSLIPNMHKLAGRITKHAWIFLVLFALLITPAFIGYHRTAVFYDFSSLFSHDSASDIPFLTANEKLSDYFDVSSTHMILVDSSLPPKEAKEMMQEIDNVDGVQYTLGMDSIVGSMIPQEVLPNSLTEILKSDRYQLMLVNSSLAVSTDACNQQIDKINTIIKQYDSNGLLIGEGPCTKDLIEITDHDFSVVTAISIAAIFVIIALVLKSITLPFILVAVIELAVFINLGIPYYTGTSLFFITPICISTIQLGSTVDYAILMTTRYKKRRAEGKGKQESVSYALEAALPSVLVSACGFFAATFGVGLYSDVGIISSMCNLMARGAIISMFSVALVLPSMFMLLDQIICATSIGFRPKKQQKESLT